jgi:hypothetical protein
VVRSNLLALITSNDGTAMAIITITTVLPSRKTALRRLERKVDWLNLFGLIVAARGSILKMTSRVLMMGEQLQRISSRPLEFYVVAYLSGNLVKGTMAIRTSTVMLMACG